MTDIERLVLLTTVGDPMAAHLLVARLDAEGIEARLFGEALGPYRLTVGSMAITEIWVAQADLEEASQVLFEAEVGAAVTLPDSAGPGPSPSLARSLAWWVVATMLLALILWAGTGRYL